MTVSAQNSYISYTGNGSTAAYSWPYKLFAATDLKVYTVVIATGVETLQTSGGSGTYDYAINAGLDTVTLNNNLPVTHKVFLTRVQVLEQATDYIEGDAFPASVHEDTLDKVVLQIQQQQEQINRAFKISQSNSGTTEIQTIAADRSAKVLSFDASGNLIATQTLGSFTGNWATATAYQALDLIKDTSNNNIYICNTTHTSSGSQPISTNADVAKWDLLVDAASATTSAATATTQAGIATTQAGIATAKAVLTASDATDTAADAVSTAADAVSTAADVVSTNADAVSTAADVVSAAALLDTFDDKFLGSKASNPTLDNDGDALTDGAIFYHTGDNRMKVYDLGTTTWLYLSPTSTEQTNINAVAAKATEIGRLGTTAAVADMALLGTSAVVTDLDLLASSATVSDLSDVADNIDGVTSFAERYRVSSTNPVTDLDEGDLVFNTTDDTLKYYDGANWQGITAGGISAVVDDTGPTLGGDLDLNGNSIDFPTTTGISDVLDEDAMGSDSATKLATQQSIKAYVDNAAGKTELYGFKKTNGTGTQLEDLIMTSTGGGSDDISVANNDGTQTDLYDESILANQGLTFTVDVNGNLNVTV
jgi:hypothetical protein